MISCLCVTRARRMALLAEAVADFVGQSHDARELVLLHDGDGLDHADIVALAARYPQAAIRVVQSAPGQSLGALRNHGAAVGYLVDQLHWFTAEDALFWDDWDSEPFPLNLIQGSILARRDIMPPYPDLPRGEDTLHTHRMLRLAATEGFGVSRLRGAGWCYIYRHHGQNVWNEAHHRAISQAKRLSAARLLPRLADLRARLAEYQPALPELRIAP